tara:strand:+ start:716 stop:1708 length:993 start_codon:yes stop_codon:yes gene_type:complete
MKKKIIIFGITGQDGSLLAKSLIKKNFKVFGITRNKNKKNLKNVYKLNIFSMISIIELKEITYKSIHKTITSINPTQIYNLSAQSSVSKSFIYPLQTHKSIYNLNLFILETLRHLKNKTEVKYFNACSGECYGNIERGIANENTKFNPLSPYAISKTSSYYLVKNYRKQFNLFASNGILFNHESVLRDEFYVTKKIIKGAVNISLKKSNSLLLGNLNIYRDWGWAPEYVDAIHKILKTRNPTDIIISTGKVNSIKSFIKIAFDELGLNWKNYVGVSEKYKRNLDVFRSVGSPDKAKKLLKWESKINLEQIIKKLIKYELKEQSKKNNHSS